MKLSPPWRFAWMDTFTSTDERYCHLCYISWESLWKLDILAKWCNQRDMAIKEKTKYMSFNSTKKRQVFTNTHVGMVTVSYCTECTYLGCFITGDSKIASSTSKHVSIGRFNSFESLTKRKLAVKKKVYRCMFLHLPSVWMWVLIKKRMCHRNLSNCTWKVLQVFWV